MPWQNRWRPWPRRFLRSLESGTLRLEKLSVRWARSPRYNPLYHTGTLAAFLLLVLSLTGVYLTMFFQYGFVDSYAAVAGISRNVIGHVIRSVHRYASAALMLTTLLHAWRTFFQDRFRGPRWLAWVSGLLFTLVVWFIGATGYWMIWDQRAGLLNLSLADILRTLSGGQTFLVRYLFGKPAEPGWIFLFLLLSAHFLLTLGILFGLLYLHFRRLNRPKWLPPAPWLLGGLAVLVLVAVLFPVKMLPPLDPAQWPARLPLDLFYLGYLPAALSTPAIFWALTVGLLLLFSALPWLLKRGLPAPVELNLSKCDGCTLCARDCPYNAITMIERADGAPHKFQAQITPRLCVSCGICVGSCPEGALTLDGAAPHRPAAAGDPAPMGGNIPQKVVFACERHILHSGDAALKQTFAPQGESCAIVPLTCLGMAHPDLAVQALTQGAAEVHFVGCPAEDCANREGNLWLEQRLRRKRLPRLAVTHRDAPIFTHYLPPAALDTPSGPPTAYGAPFSWRNALPGLSLLLVILLLQIPLTSWNFTLPPAAQAWVQVTLPHRSGHPVEGSQMTLAPDLGGRAPVRLQVEVDEVTRWQGVEPDGEANFFALLPLSAGEHHLRVVLADRDDVTQEQVLFDDTLVLSAGQIVRLDYRDAAIGGDPQAGKRLFYENSLGTNAGCRICHSLEADVRLVGPSLAGVATRAASRVPGMSAEEYLRQSILDPGAYVVEGYPDGQMVPNLGAVLSDAQVDDLIAFLMTLR
ncbi:MAG: hypothetical protein Fur0018_24810 [Anaerolineales bacterium]